MHEGQQNQRADRGYSHCHEGARGHHVCARHACAPRPRTKGLCVRWCGAHGTVAHAQRGLGLCMRGLVWPSRTHHDRGMSAVPALAAPGRVEARHRSCMPHACSRHACIASSVVGLAARRGHMGGSWSGPSSHRCAQARGPQPLKHRAKQPSTGHPRCRQARARADTGADSRATACSNHTRVTCRSIM